MKALHWLLALLLLAGTAVAQDDDPAHQTLAHATRTAPWSAETLALAERLPVQDGGRVKPLSTFASFTLLRINGKRSVETPSGEKLDHTAWLLDVLFFPIQAADYRCFHVTNDEVIAAMGLRLSGKKKSDRYSLNELQPGFERLDSLARQYHEIEEKDRTNLQQQVVVLRSNVETFLTLAGQLDFARIAVPVAKHPDISELFEGKAEVPFSQFIVHAGELWSMAQGEDAELKDAAMSMVRVGGSVAMAADSFAVLPPTTSAEEHLDWYAPGDLFHDAALGGGIAPEHLEALRSLEKLSDARVDPPAFQKALSDFLGRTQELADARGEYSKIPLEVTYYKAKLIRYSLVFFILSFVCLAVLWLRPRNKAAYGITSGAAFAAVALLIGAIAMRCVIRGRPPVSTLYETLLFVTGVSCTTALVVEWINHRRLALSACVLLGLVGLFLANGYEVLDKQDTMPSLVAVLDTNFWLATHVTCITSGYAAGMLAALLANIYLFSKLFGVRRGDRGYYSGLGRMVYGVIAFAVIFSSVGTILGGIWANDSWGRFWGWDPKENGALLIVISQLAILHARMGGYLREHGVCMAAAFGGTVIAFSWFGVNLLGVGLHSYGFTSGIHKALWTYYTFQWGTVGLGGLAFYLDRLRARAAPASPAQPPQAKHGKKVKEGAQPA
jgi:ABC-type transport system involved in cytochrome c biogenesis permease subunit